MTGVTAIEPTEAARATEATETRDIFLPAAVGEAAEAAASPAATEAAGGRHAALWQAVLHELQRDPAISPASFATWLRGTQLLARDGDRFVVGAQHAFGRDRLERSFRGAVEQALLRATGRRAVRVRFVVVGGLGGASDRGQPPAGGAAPGASGVPIALAGHAPRPPEMPSGLNARYSFGSLVVGKANRFACAAARAVAENTGLSYNPLYIHGDAGCGKTHVLHAIGNHVRAMRPERRVRYVTGQAFVEECARAAQSGQLTAFRSLYGAIDVLLLDDVHALAAPPAAVDPNGSGGQSGSDGAPDCAAAQAELDRAFNVLYDANKQIVLAGQMAPASLIGFDERLRSRFQMGLVAGVGLPDAELRLAILRKKAEANRIAVPVSALTVIARQVEGNVRQLEGALTRAAAAALTHLPLTPELVAASLSGVLHRATRSPRQRVTPAQLIGAVAHYFGLPLDVIVGKRRDSRTALARQVAMYLLREQTIASLAEIGAHLGGRDHSTVLHGCEKIATLLKHDERVQRDLTAIRHLLLDAGPDAALCAAAQ
ncbi:MAG: ATP-binding protein [Chloroflexi bacterium]|nr:ATP-binding protein [Chloroflexota bacterium]